MLALPAQVALRFTMQRTPRRRRKHTAAALSVYEGI